MNSDYFCHKSSGTILWDAGKRSTGWAPHWALVLVDKGITDYYAWLLKRWGMPVQKGSVYGPHISMIKGETPTIFTAWGKDFGVIDFHYSHVCRWDNGKHVWVDVWCPKLHDIRRELGLPSKSTNSFHMTIGRL